MTTVNKSLSRTAVPISKPRISQRSRVMSKCQIERLTDPIRSQKTRPSQGFTTRVVGTIHPSVSRSVSKMPTMTAAVFSNPTVRGLMAF
jgi:hypothetical protein